MTHLRPTHFQRPDCVDAPLYVVTTLFNSARYRTRWKHYEDFAKMVEESGARLLTVEVSFGERHHVHHRDEHTVALQTTHELWLKESATNVGVQHLPSDWGYVAWIDADVRFARDDWANETVQRLQHYAVVQMWSEYQDLTAEHEVHGTQGSFAANFLSGALTGYRPGEDCYTYYGRKGYPGAPGLAWASTKDAWNKMGGLLDVCILGAGDWYMAHGICGLATPKMLKPGNHPRYNEDIQLWWERAAALKRNIGVVPGLALHRWHGPKVHRKYGTREKILIDTQYDSRRHISRDWQGLLQFTENAPIELRDRVRQYLHERKEDA
jgi:hypothetical protein